MLSNQQGSHPKVQVVQHFPVDPHQPNEGQQTVPQTSPVLQHVLPALPAQSSVLLQHDVPHTLPAQHAPDDVHVDPAGQQVPPQTVVAQQAPAESQVSPALGQQVEPHSFPEPHLHLPRPLQEYPELQPPQPMGLPQLSVCAPHSKPRSAHDFDTHGGGEVSGGGGGDLVSTLVSPAAVSPSASNKGSVSPPLLESESETSSSASPESPSPNSTSG